MSDIHNILDEMAFSCDECGSVKFNLLRSSSIECSGCQKRMDLVWSLLDREVMRSIAILEYQDSSKPVIKTLVNAAEKILDSIEKVRDLDEFSQSELAYEILIRSGDV